MIIFHITQPSTNMTPTNKPVLLRSITIICHEPGVI